MPIGGPDSGRSTGIILGLAVFLMLDFAVGLLGRGRDFACKTIFTADCISSFIRLRRNEQ